MDPFDVLLTLVPFLPFEGGTKAVQPLDDNFKPFRLSTMHGDYRYKTAQPDAAEALSWLKEAKSPDDRTITGGDGKGWRGAKAIAVVQELYSLGAVSVTAVEIAGRIEKARHQDTSTLIIELPREPTKRARLFKWGAKFAQKRGWDPTMDEGQDYMLIWHD